jgi:4a-hydroxytetrahydrobiopterin dehydratase
MRLDQATVDGRLVSLPGWARRGDALVRVFTFPSFPEAMAFATLLAFDAERRDHHPDLHISFRKVTVTWTTHSEGGLTEKDLVGAAESDRIAGNLLRSDSGPVGEAGVDRLGD